MTVAIVLAGAADIAAMLLATHAAAGHSPRILFPVAALLCVGGTAGALVAVLA